MRFWLIFLFLIPVFSVAETRPKIGLVLSGGGAKGGAHVGILKELEKNNIPVDFIVGTSIGSYVGGLYALGYTADEIEAIMLNTDFNRGYSDFIPREQLQYRDKQSRDKYNLTLRLGYSDQTLKMPSGLLLGQSALQILKVSIGAVGKFESFDDLSIPYRAIATDIATAEMVVLDSGSLAESIKASSTIPGALEPIEIKGRLLVDGGIVNNMPIDIAKSMGADIIIAVDIGSPLMAKSDINNTVDVLDQLANILTINTSEKQITLLEEDDILIRPDIDNIGTTEFSKLAQALQLGEVSARDNLTKLQHLSVSDLEFEVYLKQKEAIQSQWVAHLSKPITGIRYINKSNVKQTFIADHFGITAGDIVSKEQLEKAIQAVYALDEFDFVNAEFIDSAKGRTIELTTKAKSWGPNYLLFGFYWQGDFSNNSKFSADFSYLMTDFTHNGGTLNNEFSIGWETSASTEFYQPFDDSYDSFARVRLQYAENKFAESQFTAQTPRPELQEQSVMAKVGLGYHYTHNGISEIGAIAERGEIKFDEENSQALGYYSYGGYLAIGYDDLNSINFPTRGNKIRLQVTARQDTYDAMINGLTVDNNIEVMLDWRGALSIGNHAFVGIASASTLFNESDFSVRLTKLGGFLNLSGFQKDALVGVHKGFTAAVYQYDLGVELPGGLGLPLYLGSSIESGNVWGVNESVSIEDLITSGSLYIGTDTYFGPAVVGIGYATSFGYYVVNQTTLFFSIGKNW